MSQIDNMNEFLASHFEHPELKFSKAMDPKFAPFKVCEHYKRYDHKTQCSAPFEYVVDSYMYLMNKYNELLAAYEELGGKRRSVVDEGDVDWEDAYHVLEQDYIVKCNELEAALTDVNYYKDKYNYLEKVMHAVNMKVPEECKDESD